MHNWFKLKPAAILISILLILSGTLVNFQTAVALTPVADLTGEWSGFAQLSDIEGYCEISGKVNAVVNQNENQITATFSFVPTQVKSNLEGLKCEFEPIQVTARGTIDGSRISLTAAEATFDGWYASAGIKLDIASDWFTGTTQLSPTNFIPQPYSPKNVDEETKKKAAEESKKKAAEEEKKKKASDEAKKKKAADDAKKKAAEEEKKTENATKKEAWIDVRATHIGGILKNFPIWHLLIVYHGTDDLTYFYRGGPSGGSPEPYGLIIGTSGLYKPGTIDYDIKSPSKRVMTGKNAEGKNICFQKELDRIDSSKIAYKPRGPNSNSVAYTLLVNCKVLAEKPVTLAPGWRTILK